jgi:hypothetical protein
MMARNQISLDPELQRRARRRAAEMGISFSEYVRRLVERDAGHRGATSDASALFDLGDSRGSDVARDKDRMLSEAVAASRPQPQPRRRRG